MVLLREPTTWFFPDNNDNNNCVPRLSTVQIRITKEQRDVRSGRYRTEPAGVTSPGASRTPSSKSNIPFTPPRCFNQIFITLKAVQAAREHERLLMDPAQHQDYRLAAFCEFVKMLLGPRLWQPHFPGFIFSNHC